MDKHDGADYASNVLAMPIEELDCDEEELRTNNLGEMLSHSIQLEDSSEKHEMKRSQSSRENERPPPLPPTTMVNGSMNDGGPKWANDNTTNYRENKEDSVFKSANWLSDSELIFSLTNQVGGLVRALRIFQELDIGIKHVESRKSKRRESEFEIFVDIDCSDQEKMKKLVHHLM